MEIEKRVWGIMSLFLFVGISLANDKKVEQSADVVSVLNLIPGFRIAVDDDLVNELRAPPYAGYVNKSESIFQADFNGDNQGDIAISVVSDTLNQHRIYYALKQGQKFKLDLLISSEWSPASDEGKIKYPLFFKSAGEEGLSSMLYNSLTNDGDSDSNNGLSPTEMKARHIRLAKPYVSVPAVEVWTGAKKGLDLSYCSDTWYYDAGNLKTFGACD